MAVLFSCVCLSCVCFQPEISSCFETATNGIHFSSDINSGHTRRDVADDFTR